MAKSFCGIKVDSGFFLAPMACVTNLPFRLLCKRLGAGMVFTEQANATHIARTKGRGIDLLRTCARERPVALQLFGANAGDFAEAAKIAGKKFDMINVNCGCPASRETEIGAGAALLKEPEKIGEIIGALKSATKKPVSAKIRLGWKKDEGTRIARIAEDAGVDAVIVHARTALQGYSGKANWKAVGKIRKACAIPIVVNGDIRSKESAEKALGESHCEFAMVGRHAMGNPFIFRELNNGEAGSPSERAGLFFDYVKEAEKLGGLDVQDLRIRAMHFTRGVTGSRGFREKICAAKTEKDVAEAVKGFRESLQASF